MIATKTSVWDDAGEFFSAVRDAGITGNVDKRLTVHAGPSGLNTSVDSEGGFAVPDDWSDQLFSKLSTDNEIIRRCTNFGEPRSSSHFLPYVDESSKADGSRFGGFRAYWVGEGDVITDSKPAFGLQQRKMRKLAALCYVTDELVEDAPRLAENLQFLASAELGFDFAEEIVNGSAGRPLGLLNSSAKITVDKETNQTAATVWAPNIKKMIARLWGPSIRTAVWLFNQELLPQLSELTDEGQWGSEATSVGASPVPMWDWGVPGQFPRLCGRPAIPVEHCKAPGTEGDLILTDLSQYGIVLKARTDYSMHVRFVYSEGGVSFRLAMRWGAVVVRTAHSQVRHEHPKPDCHPPDAMIHAFVPPSPAIRRACADKLAESQKEAPARRFVGRD